MSSGCEPVWLGGEESFEGWLCWGALLWDVDGDPVWWFLHGRGVGGFSVGVVLVVLVGGDGVAAVCVMPAVGQDFVWGQVHP